MENLKGENGASTGSATEKNWSVSVVEPNE